MNMNSRVRWAGILLLLAGAGFVTAKLVMDKDRTPSATVVGRQIGSIISSSSLVSVHHMGPIAASPVTTATYQHSATTRSYEDLDYFTQSGKWGVGVIYHGCPPTNRGAFRIVISDQNGHEYRVTDYRDSDTADLLFPGEQETTWTYRVTIPSSAGCSWWRLAIVGN